MDLWKTTTPVQTDPTPPPIDHRSIDDHCTEYISHIEECINTSADRPQLPPPVDHRSMEDHYTSTDRPHPLLQLTIDLWKTTTLSHIEVCTDTLPLPPVNHRSMEDHYTK